MHISIHIYIDAWRFPKIGRTILGVQYKGLYDFVIYTGVPLFMATTIYIYVYIYIYIYRVQGCSGLLVDNYMEKKMEHEV